MFKKLFSILIVFIATSSLNAQESDGDQAVDRNFYNRLGAWIENPASEPEEKEAPNELDIYMYEALGTIFENHPEDMNYHPTTEEFLIALAEKGDSVWQLRLADAYQKGEDVERSDEKAFEWYLKASEQGNAEAMLEVVTAYGNGVGVEKDSLKEAEWTQKIADSKPKEVQERLGASPIAQQYPDWPHVDRYMFDCLMSELEKQVGDEDYGPNREEVNPYILKALASVFEKHPEDMDYLPPPEEVLTALAENGDPTWQVRLAEAFRNGEFSEKNDEKAFEWHLKAAQQGYIYAILEVANAYGDGVGVERDYVQEVEWLQKASDLGNGPARYRLGGHLIFGIGVEKDLKLGEELLYQSVQIEPDFLSEDGMAFFARIHESGDLQDLPRSFAWYSLSNDEESCARLQEKMTPEELSEGFKKIEEFKQAYQVDTANT